MIRGCESTLNCTVCMLEAAIHLCSHEQMYVCLYEAVASIVIVQLEPV